jgi:hypothetical protein
MRGGDPNPLCQSLSVADGAGPRTEAGGDDLAADGPVAVVATAKRTLAERRRRRRRRIVRRTLAAGVALAVVAAAMVQVQRAADERHETALARAAPPTTWPAVGPASVPSSPPQPAVAPAGPPVTTTPPLELLRLRGRPNPTSLMMVPGACAPALVGPALTVVDWGPWAAGAPPAATPLTEADVRAEIATVMRRRFRNDDPDRAVADALALFDAAAVRTTTGDDVGLRGALAELKGTLGEPALAFVLATDRPLTIRFGSTVRGRSNAEADSYASPITIVVNERNRYERPSLLAPLLLHELLHQNGAAYWEEELINSALDARVMLEQTRDHPEALATATQLAVSSRWTMHAQLTSRVGTQMTLTRADELTVQPGSAGAPRPRTFAEALVQPTPAGEEENAYTSLPKTPTRGHPTLTRVLAATAGDGEAPPTAFDDAAVTFLDRHPGVDECTQLIAAQALGLVHGRSPGERATATYLATLPR